MILYGIDNIRDLFGHKVSACSPQQCGMLAHVKGPALMTIPADIAGEPVNGEEEPHLQAESLATFAAEPHVPATQEHMQAVFLTVPA